MRYRDTCQMSIYQLRSCSLHHSIDLLSSSLVLLRKIDAKVGYLNSKPHWDNILGFLLQGAHKYTNLKLLVCHAVKAGRSFKRSGLRNIPFLSNANQPHFETDVSGLISKKYETN